MLFLDLNESQGEPPDFWWAERASWVERASSLQTMILIKLSFSSCSLVRASFIGDVWKGFSWSVPLRRKWFHYSAGRIVGRREINHWWAPMNAACMVNAELFHQFGWALWALSLSLDECNVLAKGRMLKLD